MANSETGSLKGTHPWTRLSSVFQTPEDVADLAIECQFGSAATGKLEGKAWIDDVTLEALPDKALHTKRVVIDTKSPLKKYDPMSLSSGAAWSDASHTFAPTPATALPGK